jgi:hypothetical protein
MYAGTARAAVKLFSDATNLNAKLFPKKMPEIGTSNIHADDTASPA